MVSVSWKRDEQLLLLRAWLEVAESAAASKQELSQHALADRVHDRLVAVAPGELKRTRSATRSQMLVIGFNYDFVVQYDADNGAGAWATLDPKHQADAFKRTRSSHYAFTPLDPSMMAAMARVRKIVRCKVLAYNPANPIALRPKKRKEYTESKKSKTLSSPPNAKAARRDQSSETRKHSTPRGRSRSTATQKTERYSSDRDERSSSSDSSTTNYSTSSRSRSGVSDGYSASKTNRSISRSRRRDNHSSRRHKPGSAEIQRALRNGIDAMQNASRATRRASHALRDLSRKVKKECDRLKRLADTTR